MERRKLEEKDILYLGHLRKVFDLLDKLNDVGCQRDKAGNRELFFGDYCKLMLLYVWNCVRIWRANAATWGTADMPTARCSRRSS